MRYHGHYIEFELQRGQYGWMVLATRQASREDIRAGRAGAFMQESFLFQSKKAAVRFMTPLYRGVRK